VLGTVTVKGTVMVLANRQRCRQNDLERVIEDTQFEELRTECFLDQL
jgi:hypothetical protein